MSTFKNFTDLDVAMFNAKVAAGKLGAIPAPIIDGPDDEAQLHRQIMDYCRQRRWFVVHSRMDRATTTARGIPDFVIAADAGKSYWIEAKGKKTKVTREQAGTLHWLTTLGHTCAAVRSLEEFLQIVNAVNKPTMKDPPQ